MDACIAIGKIERRKCMKQKMSKKLLEDFFSKHREKLNLEDEQAAIHFFGMYEDGCYIYTDVLKRNLKISKEKIETMINLFLQDGILEKYYYYICPVCCMIGSLQSCDDEDVTDEIYCCSCDSIINTKNARHYAYRVVKTE